MEGICREFPDVSDTKIKLHKKLKRVKSRSYSRLMPSVINFKSIQAVTSIRILKQIRLEFAEANLINYMEK